MSDKHEPPPNDTHLNPELRQRTDATHDTTHPSPAPADSASVQRQEGRAWPFVWLGIAVIGCLFAVWLLIG